MRIVGVVATARTGKWGQRKGVGETMVTGIFLLATITFLVGAQSSFASPRLTLERNAGALELVLDGVADPGALFVYEAADLEALASFPSVIFETNTPTPGGLRLQVAGGTDVSAQAFFAAAFFAGRSVEEFGDAEYALAKPNPTMVLLASGMPSELSSGQVFRVDFFVVDPAGDLLDVSGPVVILVLQNSDGALHADAVAVPAGGELVGGHMRVEMAVEAVASLAGYTLGLGPPGGLGFSVGSVEGTRTGLPPPAQSGGTPVQLSEVLKVSFNLGPEPLVSPTRENVRQALETRRQDAADADPLWSDPLAGGGVHAVRGVFGEWRGQGNGNVHRGLDLEAPPESEVYASRGGVISRRGVDKGGFVVIDHGDGWFSRYLRLAKVGIVVAEGQAVVRGERLANGLDPRMNRLHFEIREGDGQAQWRVRDPGRALDPLQIPGIFAVSPGNRPPELEEVGWTRQHPGQTAFVKGASGPPGVGPVYLFAKWADKEASAAGGEHRVGLRSMGFQAEGVVQPAVIHPSNDTAIAELLPPGAGRGQGFARYSAAHIAKEDPKNHFQYWWEWNTAIYANDRRGPRTVSLTGEDWDGNTTQHGLTFGPEVKGGLLMRLSGEQFQFRTVAHLGADLVPGLVQPDQYELEVLRANGETLEGVVWGGAVLGNRTEVFGRHQEEAVYTLTLPPAIDLELLTLRVSSLLVPDLAHDISFRADPNMIWIAPGTFLMGSPTGEAERYADELAHQVTISRGFWMGRYEVTQAEYWEVMGMNPSYFQGGDRPVEMISWFDAEAYCQELSQREQGAGRLPEGYVYRLPTEAEWEYACRAGTSTAFHYGFALRSGMANFYGVEEYDAALGTVANPAGVHLDQTTPVGSYAPNEWGLHDMHGNVWEWCLDWYGAYPAGNVVDPTGPSSGFSRVCRGGSWTHGGRLCRAACRYSNLPDDGRIILGFRVVLVQDQP